MHLKVMYSRYFFQMQFLYSTCITTQCQGRVDVNNMVVKCSQKSLTDVGYSKSRHNKLLGREKVRWKWQCLLWLCFYYRLSGLWQSCDTNVIRMCRWPAPQKLFLHSFNINRVPNVMTGKTRFLITSLTLHLSGARLLDKHAVNSKSPVSSWQEKLYFCSTLLHKNY